LANKGSQSVLWRAQFVGQRGQILINGKPAATKHTANALGQTLVYAEIDLKPGTQASAEFRP
jgi:hypothetical protein